MLEEADSHCSPLSDAFFYVGLFDVFIVDFSKVAVDVSTCMMTKAQERVRKLDEDRSSSVSWILHDLNDDAEAAIDDSSFNAVVSTLVIEHIASLARFFQTIYRVLKKSGDSWAFITAMHPNMYRAGSQASFVTDESTGDRLCGVSFDHSIDEISDAAAQASLVLMEYSERGIDSEEHAQQLGVRAHKWIGVNIHASFLFRIRT